MSSETRAGSTLVMLGAQIERCWAFLFALGAVWACDASQAPTSKPPAAEPVREITDNFSVRTSCSEGPRWLILKTGLRARVCASRAGSASLTIAQERADAQVDAAFLPVGPAFVLHAPDPVVALAYPAQSYQIRAGYRPVLVERRHGIPNVLEARFEQEQFRAEVPASAATVFRFGLLPIKESLEALPPRSAAP